MQTYSKIIEKAKKTKDKACTQHKLQASIPILWYSMKKDYCICNFSFMIVTFMVYQHIFHVDLN